MTDRVRHLIVKLDDDYRDREGLVAIVNAIRLIRGVATITAAVQDPQSQIACYLALADRVFQVADSDADAETKYDQIFSAELSIALHNIFPLSYYDPDTTCEADVRAFVSALREQCAELRKIGAVA